MLTICRQFRSPKGARKPVVGPVACYRGVGTSNVLICGGGIWVPRMSDGLRSGGSCPVYRACVDRATEEKSRLMVLGDADRPDSWLPNLHNIRGKPCQQIGCDYPFRARIPEPLPFIFRSSIRRYNAAGRWHDVQEMNRGRLPRAEKRTTRRILRAWQIKNSRRARNMSKPPRG